MVLTVFTSCYCIFLWENFHLVAFHLAFLSFYSCGNEQITLINQYNGYLPLFRLKLAGCTTSCLSAQAAWKLFLLLLKRYEKIQNEQQNIR